MFKRMFNTVSKRLAAGAIVALALAFPVATTAAQTVKLESSLGVLNVTRKESKFKHSTSASYDQVVKLQVYYHNTEEPNSGKIAKNLTVKINIPNGSGKTQTVTSKVSADNANTVKSTATISLDKSDAYLQYIPGSAIWRHNTGTNKNIKYVNTKISDKVVTSGAGLRLENEKPCYNFSATVTVLARVMVPGVTVEKHISENGKWVTSNQANPGETVKYMITYKNTGNTQQNDVVIRDGLPKGMTLVNDSTYLYNATNPNGVLITSNNLSNGGIVIGNYGPGANAFVIFKATLPSQDTLECGDNDFTNIGIAHPKGMSEYYAKADTKVTKECETTQPKYSCDEFDVTTGDNRLVTVNKFKYTATNGATFSNVVIDWDDDSEALTTDAPVGKTHTYAEDGTYNITATAHFKVDGQDVTADGCSATVKFSSTPTTPNKPVKELSDTGPGAVFGLAALVAIVVAVAHRLFAVRRSVRQ
ncbi:DUF11 domain-containing protein [Candidatus Saccharibacteria bacterium]|nr:DUF11 domain-containing protein [Candidatus Saccharibacteria bacterium]